MFNLRTNSRGTFQDSEGSWFTNQMFPLRIIALEYLGPHNQHLERAIRVLYNDGMSIAVVAGGIEALMQEPEMEPYRDSLGNLLVNEAENWFADKNPFVTSKIIF